MRTVSMVMMLVSVAVAVLLVLLYTMHQGKAGSVRNTTMIEKTFAMIKPDAVAAKHSGKIIDAIEAHGFTIVGMQKVHLPKAKVEEFYAVHKSRPFYAELVNFIASGPVVILALERENAIAAWRDLMGATNPAQATEGTLRKQFGTSIGNNAVHGSDAPETAATELKLMFPDLK